MQFIFYSSCIYLAFISHLFIYNYSYYAQPTIIALSSTAISLTHTHQHTFALLCPPGPVAAVAHLGSNEFRQAKRARIACLREPNTPHTVSSSSCLSCISRSLRHRSLTLASLNRFRMHSSFSFHLPLRTDVSRCRCRRRRRFSHYKHTQRQQQFLRSLFESSSASRRFVYSFCAKNNKINEECKSN